MPKIERMLVALALNDLDESVLRYAGEMARLLGAKRVYFFHAAEQAEVPAEVREHYPEIHTLEDDAERRMRESVASQFGPAEGVELRYEVSEDRQLMTILAAIRKHDIDLIVMGRNPDQHWGGTLSERVTRKSPCSVLVVPRGASVEIRRILVPTDFSKHAELAYESAVEIARAIGAQVSVLHVYHVPIGFHRSGKSYEQFADLMRGYAERDSEQFVGCRPSEGVKVERHCVLSESAADTIRQAIEVQQVDLLVMGARGRTNSAAALIGSVTERALHAARIPLLAVKRKGENMGIIQALLNL